MTPVAIEISQVADEQVLLIVNVKGDVSDASRGLDSYCVKILCLHCSNARLRVGCWRLHEKFLRYCLWERKGAYTRRKRFEQKETELVDRDPTFGGTLVNENFEQRPGDDGLEAAAAKQDNSSVGAEGPSVSSEFLDPLLETPEDGLPAPREFLNPLLQNPDGATHMFNDMHGMPIEVEEESFEQEPTKTGLRHMAGLTVGGQRLGTTDRGSGTDGGRSGKPQDGVPYGSFSGV